MSGLSFQLQTGAYRRTVSLDHPEISLKELREKALDFLREKFAQNDLSTDLGDLLLFYRHDLRSINILQLINVSSEITDGTLVEVVIASVPQCDRILVHPHTLFIHSYKSPTFCDFCGEMLFGLVKQGLKCQGCGLNYHKRCASKIPNNCSGNRTRRPSVIPLSPRSSIGPNTPLPAMFGIQQHQPPLLPLHAMASSTGIPASAASSGSTSERSGMGVSERGSVASAAANALLPSPTTTGGVPHSPSVSQLAPDIFITSEEDSQSSLGHLAPMARKDRSSSWSGRPLWMEVEDARRIKVPHTFQIHTYTKPTVCQYCKKLLRGLIRQGLQCRDCKYNCHKKCEEFVARECVGGSTMPSSPSFIGSEQSDSGMSGNEYSDVDEQYRDEVYSPPEEEDNLDNTQNIPLQRIVQSKKQTKRPSAKILRQGWMIHYTSKNSMKKKHYWRLDTKTITLYTDDVNSRYYKEIPLANVLGIQTCDDEPGHFLELRTASVTYYIDVPEHVPPELAVKWEHSMRQALMPVTPQSSCGSQGIERLKVPVPGMPGETGQLGVELQSEVEFSQIYQINPEDILGSGQFGTVYGGVHRKTAQECAIKVIDKLKFPSKQEAALRTEVDILQKVKNPGIVEFQKMFETPERIFVVMEKMRGDMLEMILSSQKGRLNERITSFLIAQILIALRYLHSLNIVHCDLKPENILLATDSDFPQVKICDFGYARILQESTLRKSVVGTAAYVAPEVLRNKGFNRSLDMWSVGVIVYVSLSGTFPFNEDEDINDQIQNAAFMYPPNPWAEISRIAITFINALLEVKISKRLTVHKALAHEWLQNHELWCDLRRLEKEVGERYLTHESDDARWHEFEREQGITPEY